MKKYISIAALLCAVALIADGAISLRSQYLSLKLEKLELEEEVLDLRYKVASQENLIEYLQRRGEPKSEEKVSSYIIYSSLPLSEELQQYTYDVCKEYNCVDYYELVLAMMWRESNFNPKAISATNDYGIMQINKCNHKYLSKTLGVTDFLDAKQNIKCGVYMISNLLHKYKNESKALMAYNMGEGGASKCWATGTYSNTYSTDILKKKERIKNNQYM